MQLRIGLAYNEKPDPEAEPPGSPRPIDDQFAEWDDPSTIAAVAAALAPAGDVIRLEADESFPARLRETTPDIVFNIAEGLHGPNREAHVPGQRGILPPPLAVVRDLDDAVRRGRESVPSRRRDVGAEREEARRAPPLGVRHSDVKDRLCGRPHDLT